MSEKIEELVEELIDDTKWAELYPNEKSQRERNKTRDELLAEIAKMEAVIDVALEWHTCFCEENGNLIYPKAIDKLYMVVGNYKVERDNKDE